MNADSCFHIGKTHKVCEDYALHCNEPVKMGLGPFAILCDGCSSSPDTDFGARLLARAAACNMSQNGVNLGDARREAEGWQESIRLHHLALDATLMVVSQSGPDEVLATVVGDGVVAARKRDGGIEWYTIEYPSGAPGYLSYMRDDSRLATYCKATNCHHVVGMYEDNILAMQEDYRCFKTELGITFPGLSWNVEFDTKKYDLVAVMSDGAQSFMSKGLLSYQSVPVWEVVKRIMAVKGSKGEFMSRRVNRFLKTAQKEGWIHTDDLSVAAIFIPEPKEN